MWKLTGTLVALCVVCNAVIVSSLSSVHYHCKRVGQGCGPGTCDRATGLCNCGSTGREGYDCSQDSALKGNAACTGVTCLNGGSCYNGTCFCADPAYEGQFCENKRLVVECAHNRMEIRYTPLGQFNGKVYLNEQGNCKLARNGDTYWINKTNVHVACGNAVVTDSDQVREISRGLVVRFNPALISGRDLYFRLACHFNTSQTLKVSAIITNIPLDTLQLQQGSQNGTFNTLGMRLYFTSGMRLVGALTVNIGDSLTLVVNSEADFAIKTLDCALSDSSGNYMAMVKRSCFSRGFNLMSISGPHVDTIIKIRYKFEAFLFDNSTGDMTVTCWVKFCPPGTQCFSDTCGSNRRKRETLENSNPNREARRLSTSYRVVDPFSQTQSPQSQNKDETPTESCGMRTVTTVAMFCMGGVILILVVICLVLFLRPLVLARKPKKGVE